MSKKKKKALPPPSLPEVTPQELEQARALIAGIGMDIAYGNAKKRLKRDLDWSSELANAVVVKLSEEGFEVGATKNWFVHPEAQTATGVVQGARRPENMTVSPQGELGEDLPVPPFSHYIPGDVVELRRSVTGWRIGRFIARPQKRWVAHLYFHTGEYAVFRPVSSFAPFDLAVPAGEIPAGVDLEHDALELELPADADPDETLSAEVFDDDDDYLLLPAKFVRKVGVMNDPLGEMQIASAQFGVPIDFSPETLAEAAALPDRVDRRSLAHRVDLTDLPFVTIDGEDARDFDDAVYCAARPEGGWRLLVAIADVSRYVKPDSPLDRDAQIRATSVYFPASVVPMLPEKLSNGLCSLNPGVDRLVMVCDAIVSSEGETAAYQFYPGVIHSHARLTYTAVWSALQGEPAGLEALGPRIEEVRRLHALYKALRARRAARHALDFETQESQADFNEKGEITGFHVRDHNDAHRMIEEAMLVANVCAAEFVLAKKQMTLFRVHDKPDQKKLNELNTLLSSFGIKIDADPKKLAEELSRVILETKERPYIQTAVLRTMQRACYQPDNIGHFGLQYPAYAHFTSPIRRYPDLLLHRTIKGILAKKPYVPKVEFDDAEVMTGYHARKLGARPEAERAVKSGEKTRAEARKAVWRRLGIICSSAERRADDASRDVMKFLKCEFLRKRIGKCWDGVVTGMCPAGVFVELEQMPVEGFVHISKLGWGYYDYDPALQKMTSYDEMVEVRLGDRVRVRLESVELDSRRINFSLESSYARHTIKGAGSGRRRGGNHRGYGDFHFGGYDDDDDDDFY